MPTLYAVITAFAETNYSYLTEYILSEPLVRGVAVEETDGGLIIAVLTEAVFFKSDGDNLEKRILLYARAIYPDKKILLTRCAADYYRISLQSNIK